MSELNKRLSKELGELHAKLHRIEMDELLQELDVKFTEWKNGKIEGFELNEVLRSYQNNQMKNLYFLYDVKTFADINAARCARAGKLDLNTLSPELKELIEGKYKFLESIEDGE